MPKAKGYLRVCKASYPTDGYRVGMPVKFFDPCSSNYVFGIIKEVQWDVLIVNCNDGTERIKFPRDILPWIKKEGIMIQIAKEKIQFTNIRAAKRAARKNGIACVMQANDNIRLYYMESGSLKQKTWKKGEYKII